MLALVLVSDRAPALPARRYDTALTLATLKVLKRHPAGWRTRCEQPDCQIRRHALRVGCAILNDLAAHLGLPTRYGRDEDRQPAASRKQRRLIACPGREVRS